MSTHDAVAVLGAVVTVVGSYAVAKVGARVSQRATDMSAAAQDRATDTERTDRLVKNLMARLERVEARADTLEDQVRALEDQRSRDHGLIRSLWAYVQQLRATLVANRLPVPEPPGGLDLGSPLPY